MKTKKFKVLLAILLITTLTMVDFAFLGFNVAVAVYENLENQTVNTNQVNVEFDAYLKNEKGNVHSKELKISTGDSLYLNVKVKDTGVLKDAKIKVENANFKIIKDNVKSEYIKDINEQENEITLNEIVYGKNVEIEIPIQFEKQSEIDTSYFDQQNTFNFSAIYKDKEEKKVTGKISTRIIWVEDAEIETDSKIEKYIPLEQGGVLLQDALNVKVKENVLPKENENIQISVPVIENVKPESVIILLDGQKIQDKKDYEYNKESGVLQINIKNEKNAQNKISWGTGESQYKIIYLYGENVNTDTRTIELNEKISVKLLTKEEIIKENTQEIQISKQGEIVSQNVINTESVYKGYLYASAENETIYEQKDKIEISKADSITEMKINTDSENYTYLKEAKGKAKETKVEEPVNNSTYYKTTTLSKENVNKILGSEGKITIKNENDQILQEILASNDADKDGNFVVNYDGNTVNKIEIVTTKPIQEGTLEISHTKAIRGNTGYTKEKLKLFTNLEENIKVTTNVQENIAQVSMNLLDTVTQASIESSNENLSTLQKNENVQITATLNSNSEKYDLYKNPYIEIQFPEEVEEVKINSVSKVFMQEFEVKSAEFISEQNKIKIQFNGEQTEFKNDVNQGARVIINADITVNKDTASKESKIKMIYTNENGAQERYEVEKKINLISQYGVLVYADIDNYNQAGENASALTNQIAKAQLDMGVDKRIADIDMAVVNNYDTPIEQMNIIGEIPQENEKSTFLANLVGRIETNLQDATIMYSYENETDVKSDKWVQDVDDFSKVRAYKIVLKDNKLESKQVLKIPYKIEIPSNLGANQSTYNSLKVSYLYNGQYIESNSVVNLETLNVAAESEDNIQIDDGTIPNEIVQENNGIETSITVTSGGKTVADGEEVFEGQTLRYLVKVTNKTKEDLKNLKLTAKHTNAIFFGNVEKEVISVENGGESAMEPFYEEDPTLEQKEITLDILGQNQTTTFEYEFSVKEKAELEQTTGDIKISADGHDDVIIEAFTNLIKDAKLKTIILEAIPTIQKNYSNSVYGINVKIDNLSGSVQNAFIEMELPEYMRFDTEAFRYMEGYEFVSFDNHLLKLKVPNIGLEGTKISIPLFIEYLPSELKQTEISLMAKIIVDDNIYTSNIINQTIYQNEKNIEVKQVGNIDGDTVKNGDRIIFTNNLTNSKTNSKDKKVDLLYIIPSGVNVKKVYIIKDGKQQNVELASNDNSINANVEVKVGETVQFVIEVDVDTQMTLIGQKEITSILYATDSGVNVNSNYVTYKIADTEKPNDDENDKPNGDNNQNGDSGNSGNNTEKPDSENKYQIAGVVWVDKDKNGMRDKTEEVLSNIKVNLLDAKTGAYVKDENNNDIQTLTNENGEYTFSKLKNGEYIVAFEFDSVKYRVTEYQKQGVDEKYNSDVINSGLYKDKVLAITDIIKINGNNFYNIDAGLIQNEKFDFALTKTIKRITVKNSAGIQVYEYNDAQLTKVEIESKKLSNSIVLIEYKISLKNEGELPGYVNEVIDYIPSDLKFNSEMNKDWYVSTDGNLHSLSLTNELINPGETRDITLTLMKTMSANNTGTTINVAEIAKTSNELSFKDIDSTGANRIEGEDDISKAEVIISVKTGMVVTISIGIILVILIGTLIFVYIFKRKEGENE